MQPINWVDLKELSLGDCFKKRHLSWEGKALTHTLPHAHRSGCGILLPVEICPTSSSSQKCAHQASQLPAELTSF